MTRIGTFLHPSWLAAALTQIFITAAAADVVNLDEFSISRSGSTIFDDSFDRNTTLTGGTGTTVPAGMNFSDGSAANYFVAGTIPESTANNGQAQLNTANGIVITQPPPFLPLIQTVHGTLETGTNPSGAHALTPSVSFSAVGLFDLAVPPTVLGTYQMFVTNRDTANSQMGNDLFVRLRECQAGMGGCGSAAGPVLQFQWADFINNTSVLINQVPLTAADLADPQVAFEFSHAAGSDIVTALYAFGSGNTLATFNGTFATLGSTTAATDVFTPTLDFVQPGFEAFAPVPAPILGASPLALTSALLPLLVGFAWRRSRS